MRWYFNLIPAVRGTGGWITYIAADWKEVRVKLPLNFWTRNYVGTIFGGSLYGILDPVYMIMLIQLLGPDYVVWDKAASIRFKKPGRSTLYATFKLDVAEIERIKAALETQPVLDCIYPVDLVDRDGEIHVLVEKTINIRRTEARGK
jgi:acyl-coenzyme A thioesterase PaaI-like protein